MNIAYLAAGCFWGVQYKLDQLPGVISTEVGYMGGQTLNPSYKDVCNFETGHAEVVKVSYDESVLTFENLLRYFFEIHNPTTLNRQGPDIGTQYRSAIFTQDTDEIKTAENIIKEIESKLNQKVVTSIEDKLNYYTAEEYHQKYLVKNPGQCHI
jgi:methionine-S-sulfoxide reductase